MSPIDNVFVIIKKSLIDKKLQGLHFGLQSYIVERIKFKRKCEFIKKKKKWKED